MRKTKIRETNEVVRANRESFSASLPYALHLTSTDRCERLSYVHRVLIDYSMTTKVDSRCPWIFRRRATMIVSLSFHKLSLDR